MSRFEAVIEGEEDGGAWVEIPPEVVDELGGGGRIPVNASFDGHSLPLIDRRIRRSTRSGCGSGGAQHYRESGRRCRPGRTCLDEDERTVDVLEMSRTPWLQQA